MTQVIKFLRQIFEINLINFYILFFLQHMQKIKLLSTPYTIEARSMVKQTFQDLEMVGN